MRTLANKRERWAIFPTRPTNPGNLTASDAEDGVRVEEHLLSDSRISATGATTVSESAITEDEVNVPIQRQFEGSVTAFRMYDAAGEPDSAEDIVHEALKEFGTRVWILVSEGVEHTEDFASGQGYDIYEVLVDESQRPSDRGAYFKKVYPLFVQRAWTNCAFSSGTG